MWEMHCKCVSSRASLKIKQQQQKITTPNKTPPNHKQNKQKKKIHTSILIICLFMEWHVLIYLYRLQTCHKERQLFSPWYRKQPQVLWLNEKHCCTHKDHSVLGYLWNAENSTNTKALWLIPGRLMWDRRGTSAKFVDNDERENLRMSGEEGTLNSLAVKSGGHS